MEPEEIKQEYIRIKAKLENRKEWNVMVTEFKGPVKKMKSWKFHRNCGGIVVYREPDAPTHFAYAGYCLKCEAFPISDEDIIFESVV